MSTVPELRLALSDEVRRLEPPLGLETRVIQHAMHSSGGLDSYHLPGRTNARRRLVWPRPATRFAVVLMAVILAVAVTAAFLTLHRLIALAPAHPPPFKVTAPGAGACYRGCTVGKALFVSSTVGFLIENTDPACPVTCPPPTSVLFRTDDGGHHWIAVHTWLADSGQTGPLIAGPDAKELLMVGALDVGTPIIQHSDDGGFTWAPRGLPPGAGQAAQTVCKGGHCIQANPRPLVYFATPREGWMLSQEQSFSIANLFHTVDSGLHWALVAKVDITKQFDLDLAIGLTSPNGVVDHSLPGRLMVRSNSDAWFILSPYLFRSVDGGLSWQLQNVAVPSDIDPSNSLSLSLKFFNERDGVLELKAAQRSQLKESTFVYTTSDAGDHWSNPVQIPNVGYLDALFYIDSTHWVGLPYGGGWMRTADAGQHWDVIPATTEFGAVPEPGRGLPAQMPTMWPPLWFAFLTPLEGWAYVLVQPNGASDAGMALFQTTDGGVNWTPLSLPDLG